MNILLVAAGLNNEIGIENKMPWHLPRDLKFFKETTKGHPVVMGRKTYEAIGKPLPDRTNIVISGRDNWFEEGILIVPTIKEALKFAAKIDPEVYIIGGGQIFEQTMPVADRLLLTRVHHSFPADVYFPVIDEKVWRLVEERPEPADELNAFDVVFQVWERITPGEI